MKNLVFVVITLLFTFSCSKKLPIQTQRNIPAILKITSIKADNLSEELTGNDEIFCMTWFVKDSKEKADIVSRSKDSLIFERTNLGQEKALITSYSIDSLVFDKEYLIILLTESDTDRSLDEITSIAESVLQKVDYKNKDSVATMLSKKILDDDLLGLVFYKLTDLQKPTGTIIISGTHLFDKYSYRLSYRLE